MVLQLIGPEYVLACRPWIVGFSPIFVKGVDNEIAIDLDRFLLTILVEREAATEATRWSLSLRVADRVDPNREHS